MTLRLSPKRLSWKLVIYFGKRLTKSNDRKKWYAHRLKRFLKHNKRNLPWYVKRSKKEADKISVDFLLGSMKISFFSLACFSCIMYDDSRNMLCVNMCVDKWSLKNREPFRMATFKHNNMRGFDGNVAENSHSLTWNKNLFKKKKKVHKSSSSGGTKRLAFHVITSLLEQWRLLASLCVLSSLVFTSIFNEFLRAFVGNVFGFEQENFSTWISVYWHKKKSHKLCVGNVDISSCSILNLSLSLFPIAFNFHFDSNCSSINNPISMFHPLVKTASLPNHMKLIPCALKLERRVILTCH